MILSDILQLNVSCTSRFLYSTFGACNLLLLCIERKTAQFSAVIPARVKCNTYANDIAVRVVGDLWTSDTRCSAWTGADTIEVCLDGRWREYSRSDGKRGFRSTREYIIRRSAPCESSAHSAIFSAIRDIAILSCQLGHQELLYLHVLLSCRTHPSFLYCHSLLSKKNLGRYL